MAEAAKESAKTITYCLFHPQPGVAQETLLGQFLEGTLRLKDRVVVRFGTHAVEIRHGHQGFALNLLEELSGEPSTEVQLSESALAQKITAQKEKIAKVIDCLQRGKTACDQLAKESDPWCSQIAILLAELQRRNMLTIAQCARPESTHPAWNQQTDRDFSSENDCREHEKDWPAQNWLSKVQSGGGAAAGKAVSHEADGEADGEAADSSQICGKGSIGESSIEEASIGEASPEARPEEAVRGQQFYPLLCDFLARLQQQFPPSPFLQGLIKGTLSRAQIVGYALESYQVTALCPRLLAPALGHNHSPQIQMILQEFFVSELYHDQLLEKALGSVGFTPSELQKRQPLPMTFGVCSTLGVLARQHPLSFYSALMLFEADDAGFYEPFVQQCQRLGLPEEFYRPILRHAHINETGNHDQMTQRLLAEVPYLSWEDQRWVKRNLAVLMESMVLRTHEILTHYS